MANRSMTTRTKKTLTNGHFTLTIEVADGKAKLIFVGQPYTAEFPVTGADLRELAAALKEAAKEVG